MNDYAIAVARSKVDSISSLHNTFTTLICMEGNFMSASGLLIVFSMLQQTKSQMTAKPSNEVLNLSFTEVCVYKRRAYEIYR